MDIFELRITDYTSSPILWTTHSVWDTEANALEAARLFKFHKFVIQPRRVMNSRDLLNMGKEQL